MGGAGGSKLFFVEPSAVKMWPRSNQARHLARIVCCVLAAGDFGSAENLRLCDWWGARLGSSGCGRRRPPPVSRSWCLFSGFVLDDDRKLSVIRAPHVLRVACDR